MNFTVKFLPYQLYPEASNQGEDKYEWYAIANPTLAQTPIHNESRYKTTKYNNSDEQMKKYTTLMSAYGIGAGIDFKFHGTVANTLSAHRLIQHFQEEMGPETANRIVDSLYKQYFEEEAHPAAPTTLLNAALDAGVERAKAEAFVGDEYEALPETKLLIREQKGNGVEYVTFISILLLDCWSESRILTHILGVFTLPSNASLTLQSNPAPYPTSSSKANDETLPSRAQRR